MAPVSMRREENDKIKRVSGKKYLIRKSNSQVNVIRRKSSRSKTFGKKKQKFETTEDIVKTGVIHIAHIPHGFYEDEMKAYFSQFGTVLRVKVGRSTKTGRHLNYAYVKFADECVAEIAAETMNNYLMFGKLLKCKIVPLDRQKPKMFSNNLDSFRRKVLAKQEKPISNEKEIKWLKKMKKSIAKTEKKLASLGINFTFSFEPSENKEFNLDDLNVTSTASDEVTDKKCSQSEIVDDEITVKLPK